MTQGNDNTALPLGANWRVSIIAETGLAGLTESAVARRRYQQPKPEIHGAWWTVLVWQDEIEDGKLVRRRRRLKLAKASTIGEREAKKIASETLRPMNQGLMPVGSAMEFRDFVETVYRPVVLPTMSASTTARYESIIRLHLEPAFGSTTLRDVTALGVQRFVTSLAGRKLGYESVDKIRDVLSAILGAAVQYELLVKNPAANAKVPTSCKRTPRSKPYLTPDQFRRLLAEMSEPYSTMVYVAVGTGLRVSELAGLLWRNVGPGSLTIEQRFHRGDFGEPKTEASKATVPVSANVIERIQRLKTLAVHVRAGRAVRKYPAVRSDAPNALVFQSVSKGLPMRDNNILVRHIKPAARKLGIPWVNWQVLRRSFATWLKSVGADVKDAQALMRHSRASTTLDVYQQFVPESQAAVVEKIGRLM